LFQESNLGAQIDAFDAVWRINWPPLSQQSQFDKDLGVKQIDVYCNLRFIDIFLF
jgi:hypothetical protein